MRHYEVCFLVHPDQSEQVPAMLERYGNLLKTRKTIQQMRLVKKPMPLLKNQPLKMKVARHQLKPVQLMKPKSKRKRENNHGTSTISSQKVLPFYG